MSRERSRLVCVIDRQMHYAIILLDELEFGDLFLGGKSKGEVDNMAKFYPGGKKKAFNITYDDGVLQDVAFVALLNRYEPNPTERTERKYRRFCALYNAALEINRID